MGRLSWRALAAGAYWIDVVVGHLPLQLMIDTGLTDPRNQLGFVLEPGIYDQLKQAGQLTRFRTRISRDASGHHTTVEAAETTARLFDVRTSLPEGPAVRLFVSRGMQGVPGRAGTTFFHHLADCEVEWDLNAQTWSIKYV